MPDTSHRLCVGGTFNPIHNGHLQCARSVATVRGFKTIELIPANVSPHKPDQLATLPFSERVRLCRLAVGEDNLFIVNDLEGALPAPSYTIATVRALKSQGWNAISWLIGADQLNSLPSWREANALLAEVNFVVVARPGHAFRWKTLPPAFRVLESHVVEAPLLDISSTEIRRRVRGGESIDGLVPPRVAEEIRRRGYYR